jgi:hypothetical protein
MASVEQVKSKFSPNQLLIISSTLHELYVLHIKIKPWCDPQLINYHEKHVCVMCATSSQKCDCNRTKCAMCDGHCVLCNQTQVIQGMPKVDAIEFMTKTLRELLLQAHALKATMKPGANSVLKGNLASIWVRAKFCFVRLQLLEVAL